MFGRLRAEHTVRLPPDATGGTIMLLSKASFADCAACGEVITTRPIKSTVGGFANAPTDDTLIVQQMLNAIPAASGGPVVALKVDGICGPKTRAAISRFQSRNLGFSDGRVDPGGKTIRVLVDMIQDSPAIPLGTIGAQQLGGTAGGAAATGAQIVAVGNISLRVLEPSINILRFRMARADTNFLAFMNKHFGSGTDKFQRTDLQQIQRVVAGIHQNVARFNAFGKLQAEDVILFDATPSTSVIGWTVRGGDKMSTKQIQIYMDAATKKLIKAPGHSVFLTNLFANQPGHEKHLTILHEFAHYVGPRDGNFFAIDDNAYCFEPKFLTISKFKKLHNAESIALFILEFCVGTQTVANLPCVSKFKSHFLGFPQISSSRELILK
jgi:peptidoglycan hydrolase-like protein with peptidoglycan-binding domain